MSFLVVWICPFLSDPSYQQNCCPSNIFVQYYRQCYVRTVVYKIIEPALITSTQAMITIFFHAVVWCKHYSLSLNIHLSSWHVSACIFALCWLRWLHDCAGLQLFYWSGWWVYIHHSINIDVYLCCGKWKEKWKVIKFKALVSYTSACLWYVMD